MPRTILKTAVQNLLAKKYAKQGASVWRIKIGSIWVSKCFLKRCPKCSKQLPGVLTDDGWEYCANAHCDYTRQVYTASELKAFIR